MNRHRQKCDRERLLKVGHTHTERGGERVCLYSSVASNSVENIKGLLSQAKTRKLGKLMQLGVPNRIVDHSNLDSSKFGQQLQFQSDSNNDFEWTIAISI